MRPIHLRRVATILGEVLVQLPFAEYLRDGYQLRMEEDGWRGFVGQPMNGLPPCLPGKFCRLAGLAGL